MKRYYGLGAILLASLTSGSFALDPTSGAPVRTVDEVMWPADDTGAAGPLPDGPLANADQSYLPVLLPAAFPKYRSLQLVAEPYTYSASIHDTRYRASITGTRISFGSDGAAGTLERPVEAGLGEQSAYASFVRYGVGYRITVECESQFAAACQSSKVAERLAASVVLFGGRRGEPAPAETETAAAPLPEPLPPDPLFDYKPSGELLPRSGTGVRTDVVYAPGIRFPVEKRNAYLNSQVYGIGGSMGPKGGWSDPRNYQYPWRDNFCESRSRATPICPAGKGHQGVDIRPDKPDKGKQRIHWAVATEDGRILNVGSYSVTLLGVSGTQYRYLHMQNPVAVAPGQKISRGQRMGLISNSFGGTPTTIHLHFEMLQNVRGQGFRHVPPYMSLVRAYQSFG